MVTVHCGCKLAVNWPLVVFCRKMDPFARAQKVIVFPEVKLKR